MRQRVLLDTGPLVAAIDRRDAFHAWSIAEWDTIERPFLTCEAVITEACFLLQRVGAGQEVVMSMVSRGIVRVALHLNDESDAIRELMKRYESVPMLLADACLVRMSEVYSESSLLTLDSDFTIYRRNRNQVIPVIMPQRGN